MLSSKQIFRKKSQHLFPSKQSIQTQLKRKKSISNLIPSTKIKHNTERDLNKDKKLKQQKQKQEKVNNEKPQKKLIKSLSKGKLTSKKHTKSSQKVINQHKYQYPQKNDQNYNHLNHNTYNNLNHKKSIQNFESLNHHHQSKPQNKKKATNSSAVNTQNTLLTKVYSEIKIQKVGKKKLKKNQNGKDQGKKIQEKILINNQFNHNHHNDDRILTKKSSTIGLKNTTSLQHQLSKKNIFLKTKTKKTSSSSIQQNPQKSINLKPKIQTKKISQIIQKSILYSDVNYDFKEQISLLGSGIKAEQQFFLPQPQYYSQQYPIMFKSCQSQQLLVVNRQNLLQKQQRHRCESQAAIMIQKHFRGYIQRKYIEQARYIIECVKKIQRFWRDCLQKRNLKNNFLSKQNQKISYNSIKGQKQQKIRNKIHYLQSQIPSKAQISTSLITIKDLNDTVKLQKKNSLPAINQNYQNQSLYRTSKNFHSNNNNFKHPEFPIQSSQQENLHLKDIIVNLLNDEGVNQTLKERIRNVMMQEKQSKSHNMMIKKQNQKKNQKAQQILKESFKLKNNTLQQSLIISKPQPQKNSTLKSFPDLQIQIFLEPQQKSSASFQLIPHQNEQKNSLTFSHDNDNSNKQSYVKKKLNMQISSEKYFNSPMNNSLNNQSGGNFLTSPASGMKKITSPKCLSNSFNKDLKNSYNNYFKSSKVGNSIFTSPKRLIQHDKNDPSSRQLSEGNFKEKQNDFNSQNCIQENQKEEIKRESFKKNQLKQRQLNKEDYLLNAQIICTTSPIIQCKDNSMEDINLLSQQNNIIQQAETCRVIKSAPIVKSFPTTFSFIEQFCLLITDYLRQDQQTTQIFLQKVKGLKFYKMEKVLKQWYRKAYFEEYPDENYQLQSLIMKENCQYPTIFSKSQKKMLLEFPPLRLFLEDNGYEILNDQNNLIKSPSKISQSPQNSYISFIFDVFQQSLYTNFRDFNIKNIYYLTSIKQKPSQNFDYLSTVLSQAMSNILKCAQMLCGSFQSQQMTQYEKQQRYLMNDQRMIEMTKQFEQFDESSCEMWINMLISKIIFEEVIKETAETISMVSINKI